MSIRISVGGRKLLINTPALIPSRCRKQAVMFMSKNRSVCLDKTKRNLLFCFVCVLALRVKSFEYFSLQEEDVVFCLKPF